MSKLKIKDYSIIGINAISLLFVTVYPFFRSSDTISTVFAYLMFATILVNILYYALTVRRYGYIMILATCSLFLVNVVVSFVLGLYVFKNSTSVLGIIPLAIVNIIAIIFAILSIKDIPKIADKSEKIPLIAKKIIALISVLVIIIFIVIGIVTFIGTTAINTNIVNLTSLFILMCFAMFSIFLRLIKFNKNLLPKKSIFVPIVAVLLLISTVQFSVIEGIAFSDDIRNNKEFKTAFGETSGMQLTKSRKSAYSFADEFFGIVTNNYILTRDIEYYLGTEGIEAGLSLKYDVYYPTFDDAHKSVLLNLHGSGGDKTTGNYAHRNKYFASRGYVVFDIQFGDFNEKDINFNKEIRQWKYMMLHIDAFFRYAVNHNDIGANFNNTFLTGVSMGGGLVSSYAYSFDNSLEELNINLKGIIPVYPGWDSGDTNYLNFVTKDSVPCLLVMSLSDVVVRVDVVEFTRKAYQNANNTGFACIGITFSGHGSDGLMTGRFNQAYMYYAERFMAKLMN